MPLHNFFPLCNFKYVGETLSSATFDYNTLGELNKKENRFSLTSVISDIDIIDSQYLDHKIINIDKTKRSEYIKKETHLIEKEGIMVLNSENQIIDKFVNHYLSINPLYSIITPTSIMPLSDEEPPIDKIYPKELLGVFGNNLDLLINNVLSLTRNNERTKIIQSSDKQLSYPKIKELIINYLQELSRIGTSLGKTNFSYVDRELNSLETRNKKYFLYNLYSKNRLLDKLNSLQLGLDSPRTLDKGLRTRLVYRPKGVPLSIVNDKLIIKSHNDILDKEENINILARVEDTPLDIERGSKLIYSYNQILVGKYQPKGQLSGEVLLRLTKDKNKKYLYRDVLIYLTKDRNKRYLYRDVLFHLIKDKNKRYLYDMTITHLLKDNDRKYLGKGFIHPLYKNIENYLAKESSIMIFKNIEHYLDNMPLRGIYKELNTGLSMIEALDIYKEYNKQLRGSITKEIYGGSTKFIEINKRWWWLNNTSPKDKLIVPNNDYAQMTNLLTNDNFEYLRYTNHPIDWGSNWGKDYSIPTHAISVEIMLDLVNITIMIWHKNTQGWLCCTGKEGIQFLMELIYDWYSMANSNPNPDYYRAYRWVRWEAEKVYFLDTKNGLQSVGILVANLITYMKNHHFNIFPLWRNIKAMDEERNFNHIAQNGDLMQEPNKNKGGRHYSIEAQNFDRKNIFRR